MDFIKYSIWPLVKTRATYCWWILRYGGKKNIPPEVVFGKLNATIQSLSDNVMQAIKASPTDMPDGEQRMVHDLFNKLQSLKEEVRDLKK